MARLFDLLVANFRYVLWTAPADTDQTSAHAL